MTPSAWQGLCYWSDDLIGGYQTSSSSEHPKPTRANPIHVFLQPHAPCRLCPLFTFGKSASERARAVPIRMPVRDSTRGACIWQRHNPMCLVWVEGRVMIEQPLCFIDALVSVLLRPATEEVNRCITFTNPGSSFVSSFWRDIVRHCKLRVASRSEGLRLKRWFKVLLWNNSTFEGTSLFRFCSEKLTLLFYDYIFQSSWTDFTSYRSAKSFTWVHISEFI